MGLAFTVVGGIVVAALPPPRRVIARCWRWLRTIKVTTTTRIELEKTDLVTQLRRRAQPARWLAEAARLEDGWRGTIKNVGGGAYSVALDAADGVSQIVSATPWTELHQGDSRQFEFRLDGVQVFPSEAQISVAWIDEGGLDRFEKLPVALKSR